MEEIFVDIKSDCKRERIWNINLKDPPKIVALFKNIKTKISEITNLLLFCMIVCFETRLMHLWPFKRLAKYDSMSDKDSEKLVSLKWTEKRLAKHDFGMVSLLNAA